MPSRQADPISTSMGDGIELDDRAAGTGPARPSADTEKIKNHAGDFSQDSQPRGSGWTDHFDVDPRRSSSAPQQYRPDSIHASGLQEDVDAAIRAATGPEAFRSTTGQTNQTARTGDSLEMGLRSGRFRRTMKERTAHWKHRLRLPFDLAHRPLRLIEKWWKLRKILPPTKDGRHIPIRLPLMDEKAELLVDERRKHHRPYCSNTVSSAIYSAYDFLPRQLLYQFSKRANVYFLFVSILQMIPSWSTTGNYTTIVPLMIFVSISIGREGYDDYCRHRNDKIENNRKVLVCKIGDEGKIDYAKTQWKNVNLGDIVRVQQNEWIPSDLVLLHSSGLKGQAYVETLALDGETNLKTKETSPDLQDLFMVDNIPSAVGSECIVEDPNLDLYNFEGSFVLPSGKTVPLGSPNILYRGSILRNTASCFGLVVFTGQETKVQMNATENSRTKAPKLQAKVNRIVEVMAVFVIALSAFCMLAATKLQDAKGDAWYLADVRVGKVPNLMGFIIMFNTLIPLSLYVSMEICKLVQVLQMQSDMDMYDPVTDTPCRCQTSSLNEELGQVSYMFTDKTGTLTDNIMLFRKMSVAGFPYLHDLDLYMEEAAAELEADVSADSSSTVSGTPEPNEHKPYLFHHARSRASHDLLSQMVALPRASGQYSTRLSAAGRHSMGRPSMGRPSAAANTSGRHSGAPGRHSLASSNLSQPTWTATANPRKPQHTPSTLALLEMLLSRPSSLFAQKARFFLLALSLCHSATPEVDLAARADGGEDIEHLQYQAASPDELALVSAARDLGYLVIDRQHDSMTIRTYPQGFEEEPVDEVYQVLDTIEFSSGRKRMSVVVRFPDGRLCLFAKGADNVMIERLRKSLLNFAQTKRDDIQHQTAVRKSVEAELVRQARHSLEPGPLNRASLSADAALMALDSHLQRASEDQMIQESGRRVSASREAARTSASRDSREGRRTPRHSSAESEELPVPAVPAAPAPRTSVEARRSVERALADHAATTTRTPAADALADTDRLVLDDRHILEKTLEQIDEFSTEGLRTLLYGHRFLTEREYEVWKAEYDAARASLSERQKKIEVAGEKLERDFEITGATAIEDKLQKGVPEAIDKLRRANIRMWMLTGDKRETAINIGYSCRLIKDYSTLVVLRRDEELTAKIMAAIEELQNDEIVHCVVVIDGQTLARLEEDITLFSLFVDLGLRADSVICCRASPAQKATMVRSVSKRQPSKVMLAIGDGANDIAMIQSADVGIGIAGREGLQAARSSDYSIGQFRFLLKLLLVHGRWNYVRTCKYILATFFKEFFFYMSQVVFQRATLFTGTSLFESWSISMFNTLFTSLPVICLGTMDQDLRASTLLAVPELYTRGQRNEGFGIVKFLGWLVMGMLQCVMTYFLATQFWGYYFFYDDNTLYPLGTVVFTGVVFIICTKLLFIEMHTITILNWGSAVLSMGGYLIWNILIGAIFALSVPKTYYVSHAFVRGFGKDTYYWAVIILIWFIGSLFEVLMRLLRQTVFPNDVDAFEVLEQVPQIEARLDQEAEMELQPGWEAAREQPTSWKSVLKFELPGPKPRTRKQVVTSRRRRRDRWLEKLHIGRRSTDYDREIEDILEQRERQFTNAV